MPESGNVKKVTKRVQFACHMTGISKNRSQVPDVARQKYQKTGKIEGSSVPIVILRADETPTLAAAFRELVIFPNIGIPRWRQSSR